MDASPPQPQLHHNHYQHAPDGGIWPNGPVQLARGRQPRDANAKTVSYDVSTLDEFETRLREYLHNPPDEPEHTECQLSFWIGTSFLVSAPKHQPQHRHTHPQPQHQPQQQPPPPPGQQPQLHPSAHPSQPPPPSHTAQGQPPQIRIPQAPPGYQPANGLAAQYAPPSHAYQSMADPAMGMNLPAFPQHADSNETSPISATSKKPEQKVSLSVLEALQPTADPKIKMRNQRAIAKCCVDAIQKVDGYRYSFHNCWNSREDDSFRFSYYCNDSLLNKDRAANGKGAKLGKRATKPVYDCKGVLSVKFSAKKQSLDVFYKHIPIHKTYEERAPPPRKDSKRRKFLEENDPDALLRIANRPKPPKQEFADPNAPPKQKKKKLKTDDAKPATNSIESDLRAQSLRSLLELIQVDPPAPEPAAPEQPPPPPALPAPNPEPVIQQPPPPPPPQPPQPPPRKRPRNSCDICKAKKTKCDGTRPVCKTCIDKKRQCLYSDNSVIDDRRQSLPVPLETTETVRQAQAANHELSELEKMKRELEEAKARIQELEAEKRDSTTPSQTPTMTSRPQSQPQPPAQTQRHQPPPPQAQPQPQPQAQPQSSKQQRQQAHQLQHQHQQQQQQQQQLQHQPPSQQRQQHVQHQQLSQPNQTNQHTPHVQNNQQQITYKIDSDAPQPQLQTAQQLQTPQYFTNPANHNAYGINRPIPQNTMAQNNLSPQAPPNLSQPQANHQMHTSTTGLNPTAETTNPYGRQFEWPAAYYGYQSAQQHQQDQWAAARNPGVYR